MWWQVTELLVHFRSRLWFEKTLNRKATKISVSCHHMTNLFRILFALKFHSPPPPVVSLRAVVFLRYLWVDQLVQKVRISNHLSFQFLRISLLQSKSISLILILVSIEPAINFNYTGIFFFVLWIQKYLIFRNFPNFIFLSFFSSSSFLSIRI